jgi:hypothetical protein
LSPILGQHIDNFLEVAEVIRDAGLYGWRRSGHLDSKPIAWGTVVAQFEKSLVRTGVMLSLRSILREAHRHWPQLHRCAPDPSGLKSLRMTPE